MELELEKLYHSSISTSTYALVALLQARHLSLEFLDGLVGSWFCSTTSCVFLKFWGIYGPWLGLSWIWFRDDIRLCGLYEKPEMNSYFMGGRAMR